MKWIVHAEVTRDGVFGFHFPPPDNDAAPRAPESAVPVEQLLASVASCFGQSCQIVMGVRGEEPCDVRIEVIGEKAPDRPNRLEQIDLSCELVGVDPDRAAHIKRDAKRICTVTNSLACDFRVAL